MGARTAKEIAAELARDDRARTVERKRRLRSVLQAAADVALAEESGRKTVAAAEAALAEAERGAEQLAADAAARAGEDVTAALAVFTSEELAKYTGLSPSQLRQWRKAARPTPNAVTTPQDDPRAGESGDDTSQPPDSATL